MRFNNTFMVVDLPAPLGPINPNISPCLTCKFTLSMPRILPYDFVKLWISITFIIDFSPYLNFVYMLLTYYSIPLQLTYNKYKMKAYIVSIK
ncbi:hypothetical protein SDC9_125428 [bioreactor metagenome]|uniref:Uncharacterized protein n=1 Tax=bioreactor metagenome TaxID=1076179 RepID=A0A645CNC4_9ZZZZ